MSHLKQNIENTKQVSDKLAESLQNFRGAYSVSIARVDAVDKDKRTADLFMFDEQKKVSGIVIEHVNTFNILGMPKVGDLVLVLHRQTQSVLIVMKLANDRLQNRKVNPDSRAMQGIGVSYAGGSGVASVT